MSYTVAVVLATYNGQHYLAEQLRSVADQTLRPDLLVVTDDGSTDASLDVVAEFARTAPFEVVIRKNAERLGYGQNFLSATTETKADIIAFCDQDDIWLPEKMAVSVAALQDPDVVLAVHKATLVDTAGNVLEGEHHQHIDADRVAPPLTTEPWGFYSGFTMTFRRDLLDLIPLHERGVDGNQRSSLMAHDRWVYFLAMCVGGIALVNQPLALYRQHGNNLYGNEQHTLKSQFVAATGAIDELADRVQHYGNIAAHRVRLLREAAECNHHRRPALERAVGYWSAVAESESARVDFYQARPGGDRARRLLSNLSNGTYRRVTDNSWRTRTIVRDALCLLQPPPSR